VANLRVLEAGCGPAPSPNGSSTTAQQSWCSGILTADLAEPLTFAADASFDLVVASLVMRYLADWNIPLAEFHRVLAADGAVVFSTHHPAMDCNYTAEMTISRRSR
jgi:SAM-dependent methyltransferase